MTEIKQLSITHDGRIIDHFNINFFDPIVLISMLLIFLFVVSPTQKPIETYTNFQDVVEVDTPSKMESHIKQINSSVSDADAKEITQSALKWATEFGLPPSLLLAIAQTESTFDKHAISSVGAFGIMQVLPKWHVDKIKQARKALGNPEIFNTDTNMFLGAWIIRDCIDKYKSIEKGLLCYNGNISKSNPYATSVLSNKRKLDQYF